MFTGQQLQIFWRIKQAKDDGITILQNIKIYGIDHLTWHNTEDLNHVGLIYDYYLQQVRNGHPKNKPAGYMIFPEMVNYVDKADKAVLLSAIK